MEFLDAPLKVWHLLLFAGAFAITLHNIQKQLSAIGKCVFEVWEKMHPSPDDYDD